MCILSTTEVLEVLQPAKQNHNTFRSHMYSSHHQPHWIPTAHLPPRHVLVQAALRHPLDPREERQVLPRREGADERVELGAVADQTAHLMWRGALNPGWFSVGFPYWIMNFMN